MEHIGLALLAGLGFAGAGMLGLFGVRIGNRLRTASVAIAAGILLGIAFADLVPEAFEMADATSVSFAFIGGFLALFLIEALTSAHTHHHDAPVDGHDHDHEHHDLAAHALLPFLIGLGLHNVVDGLVIGGSTEHSGETAAAVTLGILVHQLPVGISFAAVLASKQCGRHTILRSALLLGAMIPIGAAVVSALPDLDQAQLGMLIGAAAGALAYIASGHLLPEAHSERRDLVTPAIFAITLLATAAVFAFAVEHDHGHEDEHADAHSLIEPADAHADEPHDEHAGEIHDEEAGEHHEGAEHAEGDARVDDRHEDEHHGDEDAH